MWKLIGISSLGDCKSSTILSSCWSSLLSQKVFVFMPFYSAVEQLSAPVVCCRPSTAPAALVEHRLPRKQICWWLLVLWSAWGFSDLPKGSLHSAAHPNSFLSLQKWGVTYSSTSGLASISCRKSWYTSLGFILPCFLHGLCIIRYSVVLE